MTEQVGAERLLFGTGFPSSDMMPAITMLTYAEISDSDRRLIASGNLDRLIGGIRK
jgi:predicted TIM-barrel fold metal-dependent hydrolase